MTPAWAQRREALLNDCIVAPDVFDHMVDRLHDCVVPINTSSAPLPVAMGEDTEHGKARVCSQRGGRHCAQPVV